MSRSILPRLAVRDLGAFIRLSSILSLVYLANGLLLPLIAVYIGSLGASTSQIGLVLAAYQTCNLLSQYWWGRFSDRRGRRKPLLVMGTLGIALAYTALALVPHYGWLFAVRAVEGLAFAAYSVGSLSQIGDLLEDQQQRGRLMSLYRICGSITFGLGALGGGWLADTFSPRVPVLVAALCYVFAFLISLGLRELVAQQPQNAAPQATSTLPNNATAQRAIWSFLLLMFGWMFSINAVVSFWPVYMQSIGYNQTIIGGLWAFTAICEVPFMLLAGYLTDRWGRKPVLLFGFIGMSAVCAAYTVSPLLAWIVGAQLLRSLAYSCFEATSLLYTVELGLRQQRGRLVSLYYSANGIGGVFGAILGGRIAQYFGIPTMFLMVVGLMLLIAAVVAYTMPGQSQRAAVAQANPLE